MPKKINSPIRYPGGKSKYFNLFEKYVASGDFNTFIEPFAGGASIGINTMLLHPKKQYIFNDKHEGVYAFWREVCDYAYVGDFLPLSIPLVAKVKEIQARFADNGKALYELCRIFESKDLLTQAAKFFILNRITFSGTADSGGYSESAFKGRFTESSIERLSDCVRLFSHRKVSVFNKNAVDLLASYNNEDTLVYLDPPYYTAKKLYGFRGKLHDDFNHEELKLFLRNRAKFKWFMSYDNCQWVTEAYKGFNKELINLRYGMDNAGGNSCKIGNEVIISNFVV